MKSKNESQSPKLALVGAALIALMSGAAQAVPTLYPTQTTILSSIKNETDSDLVPDSVDPKRFYVLPPSTAVAKIQGLHTVSANIGYCDEIHAIHGYSRALSKRLMDLAKLELSQNDEIEKYQKALFAARADLKAYAVSHNMSALSDLDTSLENLTQRLDDLYSKLEKCKENCGPLKEELKSVLAEKKELLNTRRSLTRQMAQDMRTYELKQNSIESAKQNLDDKINEYDGLKNKINKVRDEFTAMYSSFSKMYGARASFLYSHNWTGNIQKLRVDNPGFVFEMIKTSNAKIYTAMSDVKNIPGDTILAFETPGNSSQEASIELSAFPPSSIHTNAVLNVIGVCLMLYPKDYALENSNGATKLSEMQYSATATYTYPSAFLLKVTAKYNMHKMYEKIVSSGSKRRFFSSKSWSKVEERNFFKDSFTIDWTVQDPSNSVKDDERVNIESELRTQIIEHIAIKAMNATKQGDVINAAKPEKTGAIVLSDSLTKTCPLNAYCKGAAIAATVLDSMFGSGSSSANYLGIQDVESVQTWSRNAVTEKPAVTVFTPSSVN